MRSILPRAHVLAVALACAASSTAAAVSAQATSGTDDRPGVAVLPFFNGGSYGEAGEDLALLGLGLQQALMHELAQNSSLRVVDRAVLQELLAEQDVGASGRIDPRTAAQIGRGVGARYVVTGGFIDLFGEFQLTGRIVDVETTEVISSAQAQGAREGLFGLVVDMASEVTDGIDLPPLPAAVRDARREREIPPEAMVRHAMILSYRDEGSTDRAIELYRDLVTDFPQVEEWQTELRQLTGG